MKKNLRYLIAVSAAALTLAACSASDTADSSEKERFDVWREGEVIRVIDRETGCHYIGLQLDQYPPSGLTPLLYEGDPLCNMRDRR